MLDLRQLAEIEIDLKPLQGLKRIGLTKSRDRDADRNRPQTLTGIETRSRSTWVKATAHRNRPQTLTGIETKAPTHRLYNQ